MKDSDFLDSSQPRDFSATSSLVDWNHVLHVLLDKIWLIILCLLLAGVAASYYLKSAPRIYEALVTVQVQQEDAKVLKAEQVVTEDMRGLDVLDTVVEKMVNPALLEQVLAANQLLPPENVTATNGSKPITSETAIAQFAHNVKASLRHNTRLIDITVRNTDPALAAKLANSLVENYLAQDAVAQHAIIEGANTFLQQETGRQEKKLEASEQALQDYRRKAALVSLEQNQDIITPRLLDLSKRLTQGKAILIQAQGAYENSLNMSTNIEALMAYTNVASDPGVQQLSTEVAKHENDFVLIRERYREKNPKYIEAAASLQGLEELLAMNVLKVRARIQEGLRLAYQDALTTEQALESQLADTESNAMQLSDAGVRFNVLSRQVESDKAQFDSIITRLSETAIAAQIAPERIRVIQPASVPERPASPKVKLVFALAIFGGLLGSLGIIFLLESVNTSFRSVDDAELWLGLPVLGTIPRLSKSKLNGGRIADKKDHSSIGPEFFRTLRTNLSMLGRERDRRTFLFTSALPDEGKTMVSVNFAASLAQQGLRTLLVDMDLRRPMIEELFTGKRAPLPGLTDYLLEHKKFDELCLQHKDVSKLFWMSGGSSVPNPLELLAQSDFQRFFDEALAHFDRIVIDTVPLLPVSDALLLVSKVQTVVLVVGSGTTRKAVQRSVQLLSKAQAPLEGIVLNLLPNRFFRGHYYYSNQPYAMVTDAKRNGSVVKEIA